MVLSGPYKRRFGLHCGGQNLDVLWPPLFVAPHPGSHCTFFFDMDPLTNGGILAFVSEYRSPAPPRGMWHQLGLCSVILGSFALGRHVVRDPAWWLTCKVLPDLLAQNRRAPGLGLACTNELLSKLGCA